MRNLILMCGIFILAGCATVDYSFVNPDANVAGIKNVAIFPFILDLDEYAALRISKARERAADLVSQIFIKELIKHTKYEIVYPEQVSKILSLDKEEMNWIYKSFLGDIHERKALTSKRLNELGSKLGVQAILVGKVTDFGRYQQDGVLWTGVGLSIKMVDTKTGEVLWEARDRIKDIATTTHSYSTLASKTASYPIISGGVDKEPKYKTGQGYLYGRSGEFPYHTDYKASTLKLCRNIIATLPRY